MCRHIESRLLATTTNGLFKFGYTAVYLYIRLVLVDAVAAVVVVGLLVFVAVPSAEMRLKNNFLLGRIDWKEIA